jgi:propanol-preferring alcohol dehydrogenase
MADTTTMRAWAVTEPGPVEEGSLRFVEKPVPVPGDDELLVHVRACGVCRTDLHVTEGDLPVHRPGVTPGHEVVGVVAGLGAAVSGFAVGDRVGVAWLRRTDGTCVYCLRGAENLCPRSEYTGWDADGGYAEYTTVPAAFAHRLPAGLDDVALAPLLCAGIIGYRALRRAALPPGGRLGLYGFGGSAHLCAQVALAEGATVHVLTRGRRRSGSRWSWGRPRRVTRTRRRRSRSTARSCSRRSAISCRWRCGRSTGAGSSRSRAST